MFKKTKFGKDVDIIPTSACIGANKETPKSEGCDVLVETLIKNLVIPQRDSAGEFCYQIDHCFTLKGKGCVLTGTVIQGSVNIGDDIELVHLSQVRKVKSI